MTTQPTREQVVQLIAELEAGSNWLSGKHGVYSYNRQPKIAAMFLKAFAEQWMPELLSELRAPHDWKLEGFGHYKDVTMAKSDAPFRAADAIESLARADHEAKIEEQAAEIERLKTDNELLRNLSFRDERDELRQQLAAAQLHIEQLREALVRCETEASGDAYALKFIGEALSAQPDLSALEAERQRVADACADMLEQVASRPEACDWTYEALLAIVQSITTFRTGQWKDHRK